MSAAELGKYAGRFLTWRQMMATMPATSRLAVFENAVNDLSQYIGNGLDRVVAADELVDMAITNGLDDVDAVQWIISRGFEKIRPNGKSHGVYTDYGADELPEPSAPPSLGEWDAGDDPGPIPPRQWLLSNQFCRGFISSIVAGGGVGKTALRLTQFISLALGRALCGQHVFRRSRVLLINLEDNDAEIQRRIQAACDHHKIDRAELKGWLFCASPKMSKLAILQNRNRIIGPLEKQIRDAIERRKPDLVSLDPFVKTHSMQENDNGDMDFVCDLLARMGTEYNIAVDSPHHVHKGQIVPGDADSGRGASGIKDAGRLVYTLAPMSEIEAQQFNIAAIERWSYVRLDPAKVNIAAHSTKATWFRILGQPIGNSTDEYPHGDIVQVVESWEPPSPWASTDAVGLNAVLTDIAAGLSNGQRYSNAPKADADRQVWRAVKKQYRRKTEAECRTIIHAWLDTGLLYSQDYQDPEQRKPRKGLFVDDAKRPS